MAYQVMSKISENRCTHRLIDLYPFTLARSLLININKEVEVVRQYDFFTWGRVNDYAVSKSEATSHSPPLQIV